MPDRNDEIYHLRKQGLTYRKISEKYGISVQRCMQICDRMEKLKNSTERSDLYYFLREDTELCNALNRYGIFTVQQLKEVFDDDPLKLREIRNIGDKRCRKISELFEEE